MESTDLKWIKRHYGEKFSHLCRDMFPTILEEEGMLSKLLSEHFPPSRELYDDILQNNLINSFRNYIYSLTKTDENKVKVTLTPEELMEKAGYILYPECKTDTELNLPNVEQIGNNFLQGNKSLTKLNLPNVEQIGDDFLQDNESLIELDLPNVRRIGDNFLLRNKSLKNINLPNVRRIGDNFLLRNKFLKNINLPNVEQIGTGFLYNNKPLRNAIISFEQSFE